MQEIEHAIYEVEQGNTEKGLELLKKYERKANDDELFSIAEIYHEWGLFDRAVELFNQLLQKYPSESEIKLLLAEIYIDMEKDDLAIELLNSIGENDDNYIQALMEAADLYQSQGLFEVAEQKLHQAKRLLPMEPVLDFALGELAFSMGEYNKSITYFERASKVQKSFNEVNVNERLAEALAATGKWEEALDYFQASSKENREPDFLFRYGFTAYRSERMDIAIQVWNELLEIDSDYESVYLLLSKAYEKEGFNEKAYEIALTGSELDELNKELMYFLGRLGINLGRIDDAVKYLKQAIVLDPDYKEAVMGLVDIYKKAEDFEAITQLLENIKSNSEFDPIYHWELARAYYEIEEYPLALNNYNEAYNSFTSDVEFLKEYGYILVEEGRIKEAIRILKQYLAIEPSDAEVEEYLYRLSL